MNPLLSTTFNDVRMNNPTWWAEKRAAALASVYPGGALTDQPDVVEENWNPDIKPSEASSIVRLTQTNAGGRGDGGTPIYAFVCPPEVAPSGKCVVFLSGHKNPANGWADSETGYCMGDGSSVIRRSLSAGHVVIIVDMNNYGLNPAQKVYAGSALHVSDVKGNYHFPAYVTPPVYTEDWTGPSFTRLYLDHPIIAMNWVEEELSIHSFALVGHSGGGGTAIMLAAVEPRFSVVHILQGCWIAEEAVQAPEQRVDYESLNDIDIYAACEFNQYGAGKDAINVGATYPGRKTVVHIATDDEFAPLFRGQTQVQAWTERVGVSQAWIDSSTDGLSSLAFHEKTTGNHEIDSFQAGWVVAHIGANL